MNHIHHPTLMAIIGLSLQCAVTAHHSAHAMTGEFVSGLSSEHSIFSDFHQTWFETSGDDVVSVALVEGELYIFLNDEPYPEEFIETAGASAFLLDNDRNPIARYFLDGHAIRFQRIEPRDRVYLGITMAPLDEPTALHLGLHPSEALMIMSVQTDSPADVAGLEPHDIIVTVNNHESINAQIIRGLLLDADPGSSMTLGIVRRGQRQNVDVTLRSHQSPVTQSKRWGPYRNPAAPGSQDHAHDLRELDHHILELHERVETLNVEKETASRALHRALKMDVEEDEIKALRANARKVHAEHSETKRTLDAALNRVRALDPVRGHEVEPPNPGRPGDTDRVIVHSGVPILSDIPLLRGLYERRGPMDPPKARPVHEHDHHADEELAHHVQSLAERIEHIEAMLERLLKENDRD